MEIRGKVGCLFEQSGTFRDEFRRLGIPAEDYDIQNYYGRTDNVTDIFEAIDAAWEGRPSLFDRFWPEDLLMAFFPCIYFEGLQQTYFSLCAQPTKGWTMRRRIKFAEDRMDKRSAYHKLLYRLYGVCHERGLRLIIENPYGNPYLIHGQNFPAPALVDKNRMARGDWFVKPTAYWFVNCEPVRGGATYQNDKEKRLVMKTRGGESTGMCSRERSEMSPDYARNFIADFILGLPQKNKQLALFDE